MDHQYPTVAKIPVLDTRKFEQWQFRIQQYLQYEHYALWEVIEFGDSYKVPATVDPNDTNTTSGADAKSRRTVTITTEDMQRKKNDVKARTTLLLSLPDEHQLQVIVSQIQFMDVEVEKDDLNQKFLTSLAPEWLMHTIVWRNRNDLDTMSLDDLYNHLKRSSGDEDGNTAYVSTASTTFPTASASVATISQDTASAYIASQSSGSHIKFEDINQIDEDDMEEMDIKWSIALLSMRADKFWKRTGKKISIQGSDVAGFDKSKVDKKLDTLKLGKDGVDGKLAGLLKASKKLDNLIESQRRNFPTANRKFPTASRKFPTGSTKIHTADMGEKGKANLNGDAIETFRAIGSEKLSALEEHMSVSNADQMWNTLARVIQDATKDSLGVASESTKTHSTHMESWWFSKEVQTKVAAKPSGFKELLSCRAGNQEDIDMAKERYNVTFAPFMNRIFHFSPLTFWLLLVIKILYRVDGGDFIKNCGNLWFIVNNSPF
nr:ribonuclease H-like domain-containing protein [Tanacetum cinerariifolium]